ncbi:ImmA/IrrE family metallo-endopeptidase [Cohnella sp. GCM10012308]|uniref:ImmA/IrrE family metallo-endopeptidase n=1 Tax=Cohnella sp. GCM10012308 TaxID=3317329 RepID=UPI0036063467
MTIKQIVEKLVHKYGTRDPVRIAKGLGILIEYRHLKGIWGYFQLVYRIPVIHVAIGLPEALALFVIAHELGHRLLHPNVSVPFLRANTFTNIGGYEREANQFAVELLIPDEMLRSGVSVYEAAAASGVPEELAELKISPGSSSMA